MLGAGADPDICQEDGRKAVDFATRPVVKSLLEHASKAKIEQNSALLRETISEMDEKSVLEIAKVEALLAKGADPKLLDSKFGKNALHIAAQVFSPLSPLIILSRLRMRRPSSCCLKRLRYQHLRCRVTH